VLGISLVLALALSLAGPYGTLPEAVAGMFFGAGVCLLTAALAAAAGWMNAQARQQTLATSLGQIGLRNISRRPGRSLAAMGMMAGGIFLVVAVNAFRMSASVDPERRDTGTGGYALVGESSLPVYEDVNTKSGREAYSLEDAEMAGVKVVPFRVRDGDDASCLNLNAAPHPQLVGVAHTALVEAGAFTFTQGDWKVLSQKAEAIPAVVDMNTAMWGLKKGVGDTLDYTDAAGKTFQVRIAALLATSVLQGKIIIDEAAFLERYPDAAGYRFFLVEAEANKSDAVSALLTRQLEQRGLALEAASDRLAAFLTVQNTYIGIFTVLGGLGVVLGTLGLGVMVSRHVLERQGELGLMQAMGFTQLALRGMVMREHVALLIAGLFMGIASAALAVWPNITQAGSSVPVGIILSLSAVAFVAGMLACYTAVRAAMRGRLIDAIRRE
jgi:hypothetical protein